jgi:hypothetical protein
MRTTTTAVLAVGATALAPATTAHAQQSSVQVPLAGHLTVAAQMRAEHTELAQERLAGRVRTLRRDIAEARRAERRRTQSRAATASPALEAIAACESGGNPATDTGNGFYGKYQFTAQTWASVGGSGNPAQASETEQNRRAAMLYAREGASPWPVCGR